MRYLLCLLFCCTVYFAAAQDTIARKMELYGKAKPTSNLFVHFDKNVYSNNETIYFTAYLLNASLGPLNTHKILAIDVIRDIDSLIVATDRFIIENGLSFGNVILPDSILTGNYHIVAYTDQLLNNLPELSFTQPITIKTKIDPAFNASMKILEAANAQNKMHKVLISVTTKDYRFLSKPVSVSYSYGNGHKSLKTDASGQVLINIPVQKNLTDPNLYVKLKNGRDSCFISMPLSYGKDKASVRFYPEGGHMVEGLPATVGWEVKDQQRMPISLRAYLYKNNQPVDTVETNSTGIGKFRLIAEKDSKYTLKLVHNGLVDSVYQLPAAIPKGISLTIAEALVKDTLRFTLKTIDIKNLFLRLHNFRETFLYVPFEMDSRTKAVKIPLNDIPKGLMALTITDEQDHPLAERMVFAHYNNIDQLNLSTNENIYNQREKVSLSLSLKDAEDEAIVSIAVVQDNRLALKQMNDIESYIYLKNQLTTLPIHLKGLPYKDKAYLEQILLVKGWRKYNWEGMQHITALDTIFKRDSLSIIGLVNKDKKALKKEVQVGVFGDSNMRLVETANLGSFNLYSSALITPNNKKMYLFVNDPARMNFEIKFNDSFSKMSERLKKTIVSEEIVLPSTLTNNSELLIKSNEKSISLKEVVIKSRPDNSFYGLSGVNDCGDYVCRNKILNCQNHGPSEPGTTQPIPGMVYGGSSGPYRECVPISSGFVKLNGIHLEKEFYINDYKDPQEPAFFSTLYWNYGTVLKGKKPAELTFYTSDITGRFRVVVQGVTNNNVVYSESFFEVKPKQ
jgi:hypothetical protein